MHVNPSRLGALWALACLGIAGCAEEPKPITRQGITEIALPGDNFYPEGVAAATDNTLYVSSLTTGQIIRVKPGSAQAEEFVTSDVFPTGAVGIHLQESKRLLWACTNVFGTQNAPQVVAVSLDTGKAVHRHTFPALPNGFAGFCNELVQDRAGNLYATDSFLGRIIRIRADRLETNESAEVWINDAALAPAQGQFGLNGIAYDGSALYVVKTGDGKLFRIPIQSSGAAGALVELTLDKALLGADGMKYSATLGLIVVEQYGDALSRIALAPDNKGVVTRLQEGLDDPTSFDVAEGSAWVSEGQLSSLTGPTLTPKDLPFKVKRVPLP